MTNGNGPSRSDELVEPKEHQLRYFSGRREMMNPDSLVGHASEFEPGVIHVRLDDRGNDAFWLEFTLILSTGNTDVGISEL